MVRTLTAVFLCLFVGLLTVANDPGASGFLFPDVKRGLRAGKCYEVYASDVCGLLARAWSVAEIAVTILVYIVSVGRMTRRANEQLAVLATFC